MTVDDVGLSAGSAPHTGTPTVTATVPASPSTSTTPEGEGHRRGRLDGDAVLQQHVHERGARDRLRGRVRGRRDHRDGAGEATTTIYARASKAAQNDSACSPTFVTYTAAGARRRPR